MPGLSITTAVRTGPSAATTRQNSQAFFLGSASQGPVDKAVLVTSLADFAVRFGGFKSDANLHPTVETFFEEGGTQCYIGRVVGTAGVITGLYVYENDEEDEVMRITANGPGPFSADITTTVAHPSGGGFVISIFNGGTLVYKTGTVSTVTQAVGRINLSPIASMLVIANVLLEDGTIPEVIDPAVALSTGSEGTGIAGSYLIGLPIFFDSYGTGAVSCPELASPEMQATLVAHANSHNRIAILHGLSDDTVDEVLASALTVQGTDAAEHAAMFYPWIEIPTTVAGVTRVIPPDGYVAAKRAVAINQTGAHLPAAGLISVARFVTGVVEDIGRTGGDLLDDGSVNVIIIFHRYRVARLRLL